MTENICGFDKTITKCLKGKCGIVKQIRADRLLWGDFMKPFKCEYKEKI